MDNQQINNNTNNPSLNNYLVTEAIDTNTLPSDKLQGDLALLQTQEEKVNYRVDISNGVEDPGLSRAMKALRLANPFKGY